MKRTACFGTCPVYELTIAGTGKAEYCGAAFVNVRGRKSFTISEAKVRKLIYAFYEADFWNLSKKYWSPITDQPTTFVTLSAEGRMKQVEDYYDAPERLRKLEGLVDQAAFFSEPERKNWVYAEGAIRRDAAFFDCSK
jgi:hypothetical protein